MAKYYFQFVGFDDESYRSNYAQLQQKVSELASSDVLRTLWKITFDGRRKEIISGTLSDPYDILKTRCPLLNQQVYVRLSVFRYTSIISFTLYLNLIFND